jgi:hypothetical protein
MADEQTFPSGPSAVWLAVMYDYIFSENTKL